MRQRPLLYMLYATLEDIVQEASSFFKSSAKRMDVLKCAVEELADSQSHFQDEPRFTVHNEVH